ncbi:MAG: hypothetical protein WC683_07020 [bacterium]
MRYTKFAWKVVYVYRDDMQWPRQMRYFSACCAPWATEYAPGKITRRNQRCGPLCLFATKGAAEVFCASRVGGYCIFRVAYRSSRATSIWSPDGSRRVRVRGDQLPPGTVLADEVYVLPKQGV